jgi:hypothetical protein
MRGHPASRKEEGVMKAIHWIIAAAALAFVQPASAATSDPEIVIYRGSGVADSGSAFGTGTATVIHCTNVSTVAENVRFVIRNFNAIIAANQVFTVGSFLTQTVSTHATPLYGGAVLSAGTTLLGTVAIAATTSNVFCTARTVDASAGVPSGIILPMVRFNPMAGSEE